MSDLSGYLENKTPHELRSLINQQSDRIEELMRAVAERDKIVASLPETLEGRKVKALEDIVGQLFSMRMK